MPLQPCLSQVHTMLILFPSHSKAGYCFCLAFLALLGVGVFQDIWEGGGVFGNDQTELNVLQVGLVSD